MNKKAKKERAARRNAERNLWNRLHTNDDVPTKPGTNTGIHPVSLSTPEQLEEFHMRVRENNEEANGQTELEMFKAMFPASYERIRSNTIREFPDVGEMELEMSMTNVLHQMIQSGEF